MKWNTSRNGVKAWWVEYLFVFIAPFGGSFIWISCLLLSCFLWWFSSHVLHGQHFEGDGLVANEGFDRVEEDVAMVNS
jgi:hypothetical protein